MYAIAPYLSPHPPAARGLHAVRATLGRLGLLGASAQESHPDILAAAKAVAAAAGIAADCKEEIVLAPNIGNYYNRTCRAQCPSGQWTQYLFGADIWAEGSHQIPIIQLDVSRECGATQVQYPTGGATQTYNTQSAPQSTPTVQLTNATRPGSPFQVGDRFVIVVRGAANQSVSVSATRNGSNLGSTTYGQTDSSGSFSLSGVMDAVSIGNWTQTWRVGTTNASPSLSFSVSAAAIAPPPEPPKEQPKSTPPKSDNTQQPGSNTPELPKWQQLQIGASKTATAIKNTIQDPSGAALYLSEIPWWVWLAAAGGTAYALKRKDAW